MKPLRLFAVMLLAVSLGAPAASAQSAPDGFRDAFLGQFGYSAQRLAALADAMPAETYGWRPGEGVMSVELVYAHIAHYNYRYLAENLGIEAPEGLDLDAIEATTGKADVSALLKASLAHVRAHVESMPAEALGAQTTLYGRDVAGWEVLLQLLAHMNEHVGQSIAYARMNDVVPPWSR